MSLIELVPGELTVQQYDVKSISKLENGKTVIEYGGGRGGAFDSSSPRTHVTTMPYEDVLDRLPTEILKPVEDKSEHPIDYKKRSERQLRKLDELTKFLMENDWAKPGQHVIDTAIQVLTKYLEVQSLMCDARNPIDPDLRCGFPALPEHDTHQCAHDGQLTTWPSPAVPEGGEDFPDAPGSAAFVGEQIVQEENRRCFAEPEVIEVCLKDRMCALGAAHEGDCDTTPF